jgi:hypothetical protein
LSNITRIPRRRRNALTPQSDLFLQAREVQRMHDLKSRHQVNPDGTTTMKPLLNDFADLSLTKRKVAIPRGRRSLPATTSRPPPPPSPSPPSHTNGEVTKLDEVEMTLAAESSSSSSKPGIARISLHEDLAQFRPAGEEILPDTLIERFRVTRDRQSRAMVLYRPPSNLVNEILKTSLEAEFKSTEEDASSKSAEVVKKSQDVVEEVEMTS